MSSSISFYGSARALTASGLAAVADLLGVGPAEIWAVLAVESFGAGFLRDRRPRILFERHKFSARTGGRFDRRNPDISNPLSGGYGPGDAWQYTRLTAAMLLDRDAALQSASWGIGQVMGEHYASVGYASVGDFIAAMVTSGEDAQLMAMARYVRDVGHCGRSLADHDWAAFARAYNGEAYARHSYHLRLASAYARFRIATPNVTARAVQMLLTYEGYSPGPVDGVYGRLTEQALISWQRAAGLAATGDIDAATLARLGLTEESAHG